MQLNLTSSSSNNSAIVLQVWDGKYETGFDFLKKYISEHREELPHIIWKDTSPQHFEYENGYYWCAPTVFGISEGLLMRACAY